MASNDTEYSCDPLTVSFCRLLDADSNEKPENRMTYTGSAYSQYPLAFDQIESQPILHTPQFEEPLNKVSDKTAQNWWDRHFWHDGPLHPTGTEEMIPRWEDPPRATCVPEMSKETKRTVELQQHWGWALGEAYEEEEKALMAFHRMQTFINAPLIPHPPPDSFPDKKTVIGPSRRRPRTKLDPGSPTPAPQASDSTAPPVRVPPKATRTIQPMLIADNKTMQRGQQVPLNAVPSETNASHNKRRRSPEFAIYESSSSSEPDDEKDDDYYPTKDEEKKFKRRVSQVSKRTSVASKRMRLDGAGDNEEFPSTLLVR